MVPNRLVVAVMLSAGMTVVAWPIAAGRAATFVPDGDLLGQVGEGVAQPGDELADIARRHDLGFVELRAANPGMPATDIAAGAAIVVPAAHLLPDAPRRGIVINLAELRLFYFPPDRGPVRTYPISIGRSGLETPTGQTFVARKQANPTWYPPPSIRAENPKLPRAVGPGPNNPLGAFAIYLDWPRFLLHGTNRPTSIGRRVSHGCIRLYPEDIAELFRLVAVGTPVTVVDQPLKLGHDAAGGIFMEVHPSARQNDQIEWTGQATSETVAGFIATIAERIGDELDRVDWNAVREAAAVRTGVPTRISR
jgi:L,D-transpeptidase ErfK/SrfK